MRTILTVVLFSLPMLAADRAWDTAAVRAACGPNEVKFNANPSRGQQPATPAEAGKALVYVVEPYGPVTTKAGLLEYRNNVEKLRNRAAGLIHEGKSQAEVGQVMAAEFGWGASSMQAQWSLPGMMNELK